MGENCISADFKTMILGMLDKQMEPTVIHQVVDNLMPTCESLGIGVTKADVAKTRTSPEQWPEATLYEKGGGTKTGTISGLFKETFGIPVTQDVVCAIRSGEEKPECRAISSVENWRDRGYIVKGNGEVAPIPSGDLSAPAQTRILKDWKDKLLQENKKLHIYHPDSPLVKAATEAAKKEK